jgi:tRNA A-37 threonylcarbamoyl transferase component Bud32
MADVHKCPECGAELPAGAPEAPCSACLMKLGMRSWAARRGEAAEGNGHGSPPARIKLHPFTAPTPAELAPRFPQLEIIELRGQGGMGAVYKARQKSLDRIVALKIINPEAADEAGFESRFAREAKALARLNHPNIVGIHDFGEADGIYYLVMEYVDGVDLRTLISDGKLQPAGALALVPQICDALQYAHEEGIVHRDIKPENILVDKRGRVKIADFGLAKLLRLSAVEMTLTHTRQVVGTFHYMAPEQFERPGEVDHRVDIYALGVVFYEMLTGTLPVGRFDLPSQRCAVDARLDDVVLRALEREPDRRYQHASDVKTDVESLDSFPRKPAARQPSPQAAPQPTPLDQETELEEVREQLAMPAIGLMVYGALGLLTAIIVFAIVSFLQIMEWENLRDELWIVLGLCLAGGILAVIVLMTGVVMRNLESYDFAVAGAIVTLLTFFTPITWIFAIPLGVWSLSLFRQPRIRKAFALQRRLWREDPELSARRAVRKRLAVPAWGMIATGVIVIMFPVVFLLTLSQGERSALMPFLIGAIPGIPMLAGGVAMLRLRPHEVAIFGAAAALAPCGPMWLLSLPLGLAVLYMLRQPQVKVGFARWTEADDALSEKAIKGLAVNESRGESEEPLEVEEARELLAMPAIAVIVYGALGLIAAVGMLATVSVVDAFINPLYDRGLLATWVLGCVGGGAVAAVVLAAGIKMRNLDNYDFVVAGAIVTLLSLAGMFTAVIAIPLGIWSLMLLRKPGMRHAFALQRALRRNDPRFAAREKIAGVAWSLIAAGVVSVLGPLLVVLFADRSARVAFSPLLINIPTGLLMINGGLAMLRLGAYEFVLAGVVAALLPCGPAWLLSLPIGVAAVMVLRRPEVSAAFGRIGEHEPSPEIKEPHFGASFYDRPPEPRVFDPLREAARDHVRLPAAGMIAAGTMSLLLIPVLAILGLLALTQRSVSDNQLFTMLALFGAAGVLSILAAAAQIVGGLRMKSLESRWLAMLGAIAAMIPLNLSCVIGLPAGIWALLVLHRPEVQEAFREQAARWEGIERSLGKASWLLTATAGFHLLFIPFAWAHHIFVPFRGAPWVPQTIALGVATALVVLACAIMLVGAARMRRSESWNWSLAAAVAALFPLTPAVVLGLPAGLYALALLTRPGAAQWFATPAKHLNQSQSE